VSFGDTDDDADEEDLLSAVDVPLVPEDRDDEGEEIDPLADDQGAGDDDERDGDGDAEAPEGDTLSCSYIYYLETNDVAFQVMQKKLLQKEKKLQKVRHCLVATYIILKLMTLHFR
jgi:hypothetical protein